MKLVYHPGHDERYAHIHWLDRKDYPDEIHIGYPPLTFVIKRTKNLKDLTAEDVSGWDGMMGVSIGFFAKDVSIRRC